MKKSTNLKKGVVKKTADKGKESGELRKPAKLKPLKEKEKKSWKNNLDDEEEDFQMEDDLAIDSTFDEEDEEDTFYDDRF